MSTLLTAKKQAFLTVALIGMASSQLQSCASDSEPGSKATATGGAGSSAVVPPTGGTSVGAGGKGGAANGGYSAGGAYASGGVTSAGGVSGGSSSITGGTISAGSPSGGSAGASSVRGGSTGVGGVTSGGRAAGGAPTAGSVGAGGSNASGGGASTGGAASSGGGSSEYLVSMVQASQAQAADLSLDDIRALVKDAVEKAGGVDFIKDGDTVVLKPNLLTTTTTNSAQLAPEVNGITTDWRVSMVVAELVRAKNPSGKILVMEGSTESTTRAFSRLGYTSANFSNLVDEFIALEGSSCSDRSQTGLIQKPSISGKQFWVNQRYFSANWVISLPVMKTHSQAGITGAVKNLGIGATPASQYSSNGCGRGQSTAFIDHGRAGLAQFIHDYFSVRPADFVVMDALQGVQHGPNPAWTGGNYSSDRMNMRLILAARNAVALDAIESLVMGCDPKNVDHLSKLEASGLGTTDVSKIRLVGKQVSEVVKQFAGPDWACGTP